jgi:flagellar basal-body rod protein FlgG
MGSGALGSLRGSFCTVSVQKEPRNSTQAVCRAVDQRGVNSGLYIAASGMLAEMARQDQIANDLANSATPGYKADRSAQASFGELLLRNSRNGGAVGPLGLGVQVEEVRTDLAPAALRVTDEPLDFAVEGEGFFAVQTDAGVRYTRNGQFTASADGLLTDALGNPVLGPDGGPVRLRRDGTVPAGELGVFALEGAAKQGDSLFAGDVAGRAAGRARAGALEESSTDPARAMVEMISSFRALEGGQKAIQTIDETLGQSGRIGSIS